MSAFRATLAQVRDARHLDHRVILAHGDCPAHVQAGAGQPADEVLKSDLYLRDVVGRRPASGRGQHLRCSGHDITGAAAHMIFTGAAATGC
jgi:hypothetical protein